MAASWWLYAVSFGTAALVCYLIVQSSSLHLPFTADEPGAQPQKFHTQRVPRVGGLGLMAGLVVAGLFVEFPRFEAEFYWLLVVALLPAFLGGFIEDITRRVGAGARLFLTMITAATAHALLGVQFVRSGLDWLDSALAFLPFGYAALLFAVAGVAHAMNIVDGYNGLAAGVGAIALVAMGYVAGQAGDVPLSAICLVTAAAAAGFLLFNWPFGRVFLGDGGAYLLGCVLALVAALLIQRNPGVSPWFPLALVIYPVWETLFSMLRRVFVYGTRIAAPDARHLHSLVYRRISRRWVRGRRAGDKAWRNSLTALPFWLLQLTLCAFAVAAADRTRLLALLILVFMAGYGLVYWRLSRLAGPMRRTLAGRLRVRATTRDPAVDSGPRPRR